MINLIPNIVRRAVLKEYWIRVASIFLVLFSVAALLCGVFALPVYVLVNTQVETFAASAEEAASRVADFEVSTEVLTKANVQAQKIVTQKNAQKFSGAYLNIESLLPAGTVITGYELNRKEALIGTIIITGKSETRQSLADFHANLKSQSWVEKVDLPISNLAKERDIEFMMTLTHKQ
jgi:Fimbrial assembly protein (PilN)